MTPLINTNNYTFVQICTETPKLYVLEDLVCLCIIFITIIIFNFSRIPVQTDCLSSFQGQAGAIIWKHSCYQSGYLKFEFKVKNNNLVRTCKQQVYFRARLRNYKYRIFAAFFMSASDCVILRKKLCKPRENY